MKALHGSSSSSSSSSSKACVIVSRKREMFMSNARFYGLLQLARAAMPSVFYPLTLLLLTQAMPGNSQSSLSPPNLHRVPVSFDSVPEVPQPAPASIYVPSLSQVTLPPVHDTSAAFEILKAQLEVLRLCNFPSPA